MIKLLTKTLSRISMVMIQVEFLVAFDRDANNNKDDVGLGTLEHLNGGVFTGIQIDDMFYSKILSIAASNRDTFILTRADHLDNEHFNDKLSEVSEGIETLKGPSLVDIVKNWVTISSCDVSSPKTDGMFYEKSHVTKKEKLRSQCNMDSEMENFSVTIKSRKPFVR